MARHDNAAKEWGALGAWALVPSAITYKQKKQYDSAGGEDRGRSATGRRINQWRHRYCRADGKWGRLINRATGTGSSNCRVEGRRKRPLPLEAGDHRDV